MDASGTGWLAGVVLVRVVVRTDRIRQSAEVDVEVGQEAGSSRRSTGVTKLETRCNEHAIACAMEVVPLPNGSQASPDPPWGDGGLKSVPTCCPNGDWSSNAR